MRGGGRGAQRSSKEQPDFSPDCRSLSRGSGGRAPGLLLLLLRPPPLAHGPCYLFRWAENRSADLPGSKPVWRPAGLGSGQLLADQRPLSPWPSLLLPVGCRPGGRSAGLGSG
ncbi:hypothetical protein NDU88_007518 [Pleurodeles waltl]|uniref:Uncharacterized protein n=1 Tax=Pleurodeles waltl TaxID=8319 RepID=A0AAV7QRX5_PLEWA|nr:hypothetical protein NDU88_007518 [Pleurodeles waltl]